MICKIDYQPPADLLKERVILVTGAGDGIGRAVALACGASGATVILLGRTVRKLEKVYDAIVEAGGLKPAIYPLDLAGANPEHFAELRKNIERELGRLDGLLHNAAHFATLSSIDNAEVEDWARAFQVNVHAPFLLTRAVLPLLKSAGDASVVFTGAQPGRKGRAYWGGYAASKAAAEVLMEVLADELESGGAIRVNSIDPGPTRTRLRQAAYPGLDPKTHKTADSIADRYLYLLGPASRGVTGTRFTIEET